MGKVSVCSNPDRNSCGRRCADRPWWPNTIRTLQFGSCFLVFIFALLSACIAFACLNLQCIRFNPQCTDNETALERSLCSQTYNEEMIEPELKVRCSNSKSGAAPQASLLTQLAEMRLFLFAMPPYSLEPYDVAIHTSHSSSVGLGVAEGLGMWLLKTDH